MALTEDAVLDPQAQSPHGRPCEACGCPIEEGDHFCPACGTPVPRRRSTESTAPVVAEVVEQRHFRCDACGAELTEQIDQRSIVCPFCESTYVVELPDGGGRQRPEFVIGFAITPEQARERFMAWLGNHGWFRPKDLRSALQTDRLKGVYLPFWRFALLAESKWRAQIGEYWYRTETYTTRDAKGNTVTRTRRVRETEWWPLAGRHHKYHSGYLVSGSKGLPQHEAQQIMPFNLPALKRFEPYYLAGWLCEEYSVTHDEALRIAYDEFHRREQQYIAAFLPGDTYAELEVQTHFSNESSDLCLLPVYMLTYRYGGKQYRCLMNGQTGRMAGERPVSWSRVALFVILLLAALGLTALLLAALSGALR